MGNADRTAVETFLLEVGVAAGHPPAHAALTPDPDRAAEVVAVLAPVAMATPRRIAWLAVNGRRVDARVVAGDREFWVVCSIDDHGVHAATAIERARPFAGVPGGRVVIVHGPSSAGKSTVIAAVQARAGSPWVAFDELSIGAIAPPYLVWPETAPTLRTGVIAAIAALAEAGNQVITTGGGAPPVEFAPLLALEHTLVVGLRCPLDVRRRRQAARQDRWGGLTEEDGDVDEGWRDDVRFDTSEVAAADIADAILRWAA
jgi:chloramphenicol 3-O phosphotransferase